MVNKHDLIDFENSILENSDIPNYLNYTYWWLKTIF